MPSFPLRFLLLLPFLGITFWVGGRILTDRVLNRPYGTLDKLQAQSQLPPQLSPLLIKAEIKKSQGVTKVKVKSANPDLKGSVFEVPATEISQIETVIAQKLNISVEEVRQLVRYQIEN
ncbi:hypothetical protein H6F73_06815 [Microcoleus sp. FACHB-68]|nr:hypothetical protein [Microcoleus sp. FACHB-68]